MSRLEEIKKQRQKKATALDYIDLDIDWLISYAEELEKELHSWMNIAKLRQEKQKEAENKNEPYKHQNRKYKQALEEIRDTHFPDTNTTAHDVASQALKGDTP